jgi:hypothetical protein
VPSIIHVLVFFAVMAAGCDSKSLGIRTPVAPTVATPTPPRATITGRVFLHGLNGATPLSQAGVTGWFDMTFAGQTSGGPLEVATDSTGVFTAIVPVGAVIHLRALGDYPYQPCIATLEVRGDATRDLHVITDTRLLGAALPAGLLANTPLLSGVVYERTDAGRVPLGDVLIELDPALSGIGQPFARTRTDSQGRYVFCGLGEHASTTLMAWKGGYQILWKEVLLPGEDSTLDLELTR